MKLFASIVVFSLIFSLAHSQALRPNGDGTGILAAVEPGDDEFRKREDERCDRFYRQIDGTCTNFPERLWGSAGRPQLSYMHRRSCATPTGRDLPSARHISNVLCSQSGNIFSEVGLNEFTTFMGQFIDHCIIATPSNPKEPMPIKIPRDDPIFANFSKGELSFDRSVRGTVSETNNVQLPINSLSSAVDLAGVYGSNEERLNDLRSDKDGLLLISGDNLMPLNHKGLVNAPTNSARFFLAGDHRANENPPLASIHTLFLREHNRIARELKRIFPKYDNEKLFQYAKIVNIAQFQKIVFEEFFPVMTGRTLRYRGHKSWINPTLSDVFAGAAFRVGHTMVSNKISRRGPGNRKLPDIPITRMFFRTATSLSGGIETFLRGAIYEKGQKIDIFIVNALRNFLFTGIPQEDKAFDLIALNIQRGRDHCLPTFNQVRRIVWDRPAFSFAHITRNRAVQNALQTVYRTVDRVEAFIGMIAEDHAPGLPMGRTMIKMWTKEFTRLMEGDRFYFRNFPMYPEDLWTKYTPLRRLMSEREVMKRIVLQNSDIKASEIPGSIWRAKAK